MHRKQWRIISAGVIGNIIEYYDFALIGFLAVMMGELFFPSTTLHYLLLALLVPLLLG